MLSCAAWGLLAHQALHLSLEGLSTSVLPMCDGYLLSAVPSHSGLQGHLGLPPFLFSIPARLTTPRVS